MVRKINKPKQNNKAGLSLNASWKYLKDSWGICYSFTKCKHGPSQIITEYLWWIFLYEMYFFATGWVWRRIVRVVRVWDSRRLVTKKWEDLVS